MMALLFVDTTTHAGKNAQDVAIVVAKTSKDSVEKGREIAMKTGNVWVHSPVVIIVTVLASHLAAVMNVADNHKEMRAKEVQQEILDLLVPLDLQESLLDMMQLHYQCWLDKETQRVLIH